MAGPTHELNTLYISLLKWDLNNADLNFYFRLVSPLSSKRHKAPLLQTLSILHLFFYARSLLFHVTAVRREALEDVSIAATNEF